MLEFCLFWGFLLLDLYKKELLSKIIEKLSLMSSRFYHEFRALKIVVLPSITTTYLLWFVRCVGYLKSGDLEVLE